MMLGTKDPFFNLGDSCIPYLDFGIWFLVLRTVLNYYGNVIHYVSFTARGGYLLSI